MLKIADRLRLFALFGRPSPEIGERLRLFALFYEIGRQSQAVCTCCALHSRKLRNVSGSMHPPDGIGRPSQALSTPFPKIAEGLRLSAPP